jgi:hypothetical protein
MSVNRPFERQFSRWDGIRQIEYDLAAIVTPLKFCSRHRAVSPQEKAICRHLNIGKLRPAVVGRSIGGQFGISSPLWGWKLYRPFRRAIPPHPYPLWINGIAGV